MYGEILVNYRCTPGTPADRYRSGYKTYILISRREIKNKGVKQRMRDDRQSRQIKGSGRTYFLDIEETKGGKPYLRITESRKGAGDKFERNSINVFPEEEPPRSDLSPLRGSSPSLTASAVGVFDADTLAARHLPDPLAGRWTAGPPAVALAAFRRICG